MTEMTKLPTQEYLLECFDYDQSTGDLTWKIRPLHHFNGDQRACAWHENKWAGKSAGYDALRPNGTRASRNVSLNNKRRSVHRIIWKMVYGDDAEKVIDHINGNPWDNRLCNLRLATTSENMANRFAPSNNKSGIVGVSWSAASQRWKGAVHCKGNRLHVGYFLTKAEAAVACAKASLKVHRRFSRYYRKAA